MLVQVIFKAGNSNFNQEINRFVFMFRQYTHVQRNGQRIYGGPPPDWKGSYPAKGSEIFVGKVPHDIFEDEIVPIFEQVNKSEILGVYHDSYLKLNLWK